MKQKKSKKAQVQLGESLFVVIIIILLIVFGIVFYAQAQKESITKEASGFKDLETITITQYATSLTELQCSIQQVQFPNCFDETKLDAFITLIAFGDEIPQEFYFSQLGNAKLIITQIYPLPSSTQGPWELYKNEPEEITSLAQVDLPVSILNPITDTYAFGVLTIIQYK